MFNFTSRQIVNAVAALIPASLKISLIKARNEHKNRSLSPPILDSSYGLKMCSNRLPCDGQTELIYLVHINPSIVNGGYLIPL